MNARLDHEPARSEGDRTPLRIIDLHPLVVDGVAYLPFDSVITYPPRQDMATLDEVDAVELNSSALYDVLATRGLGKFVDGAEVPDDSLPEDVRIFYRDERVSIDDLEYLVSILSPSSEEFTQAPDLLARLDAVLAEEQFEFIAHLPDKQ